MALRPLHPGSTTVLIVEDDPNDTLLEAKALERFGIKQIYAVETAEHALEVLAKESCDIVLIDYNLPGMHGLNLVERVRELQPETRLIVVTGVRDERLAVSAIKAGAVDFLCKDDLLTSGIIRSLQAQLRERDAEKDERRYASPDAHPLESAVAGAEWLLDSLSSSGPHAGSAPHGHFREEILANAMDAFLRYLKEAFRAYPETAVVPEDQLIRMLMARGSAPVEVVALYRAALRSLVAERAAPPINPDICLIRLLARLTEQYQTKLSFEAVARQEAQASPS
jgi:ActR/RegA family two-component response regulator